MSTELICVISRLHEVDIYYWGQSLRGALHNEVGILSDGEYQGVLTRALEFEICQYGGGKFFSHTQETSTPSIQLRYFHGKNFEHA